MADAPYLPNTAKKSNATQIQLTPGRHYELLDCSPGMQPCQNECNHLQDQVTLIGQESWVAELPTPTFHLMSLFAT